MGEGLTPGERAVAGVLLEEYATEYGDDVMPEDITAEVRRVLDAARPYHAAQALREAAADPRTTPWRHVLVEMANEVEPSYCPECHWEPGENPDCELCLTESNNGGGKSL